MKLLDFLKKYGLPIAGAAITFANDRKIRILKIREKDLEQYDMIIDALKTAVGSYRDKLLVEKLNIERKYVSYFTNIKAQRAQIREFEQERENIVEIVHKYELKAKSNNYGPGETEESIQNMLKIYEHRLENQNMKLNNANNELDKFIDSVSNQEILG